jgi:hypothetical protein
MMLKAAAEYWLRESADNLEAYQLMSEAADENLLRGSANYSYIHLSVDTSLAPAEYNCVLEAAAGYLLERIW